MRVQRSGVARLFVSDALRGSDGRGSVGVRRVTAPEATITPGKPGMLLLRPEERALGLTVLCLRSLAYRDR